MMNTYFSRTEHLFVLSLPFLGYECGDDGLVEFLGMQWGDKVRRLFDPANDAEANRLHEALKRVRDTLRNPLAHGGFAPGIGSLYFHVPGIGALPASMTRLADGFHFLFNPIKQASFKDVCAKLDAFDAFLKKKLLRGWAWANSGLNVAFDQDSRREYLDAARSDADFAKLMELTGEREDRHDNFEY